MEYCPLCLFWVAISLLQFILQCVLSFSFIRRFSLHSPALLNEALLTIPLTVSRQLCLSLILSLPHYRTIYIYLSPGIFSRHFSTLPSKSKSFHSLFISTHVHSLLLLFFSPPPAIPLLFSTFSLRYLLCPLHPSFILALLYFLSFLFYKFFFNGVSLFYTILVFFSFLPPLTLLHLPL